MPIRLGAISTANIGRRRVVPALLRAANCEVLAAASSSGGEKAFAREFDIPRAYPSYERLLADEDVDAVYIPLPNHMHLEWTKRAADAGKHVLCEKPIGLNAQEAKDMITHCAQHDVLLMEAFMYRFHPQHQKVMELVRSGTIGNVELIRTSLTFHIRNDDNIRFVREYGGGSLYDVGSYCVNLAGFLLDDTPDEVLGEGVWSDRFDIDMRFLGIMRFASGIHAVFDSGLRSGHAHRYEVVGSEGSILVPDAFVPQPLTETELVVRAAGEEQRVVIPAVDQYQLMVEHFAGCIINGKEPEYSTQDTLENMATIDALYRSARERSWVSLG